MAGKMLVTISYDVKKLYIALDFIGLVKSSFYGNLRVEVCLTNEEERIFQNDVIEYNTKYFIKSYINFSLLMSFNYIVITKNL